MLTIRLKSFITSERFVVPMIICIVFLGAVVAIFRATDSRVHQQLSVSTATTNTNGDKVPSQPHDGRGVFDRDDVPGETEGGDDFGIPTKSTIEYEVSEPTNSTVTSKTIADDLLKKLITRIGTGRGPIIVGGIGDSGTRGVRDVLINLGAQMLGDGYVNPKSKDSLVYMDKYVTTTTKGENWLRSPSGLYNMPIRKAHSLKYNRTTTNFDHWNCGRQYVAKMVSRSMSVSEKFRGANATKLDPWGFKHPRTALLMPFWLDSLGEKFVFIHVLRDGKDIIEGDNQKVFHDECSKYYGRKCIDNLKQKIDFWADLVSDSWLF